MGMRDHVEFLRSGYEALQQGDLETFNALARERLGPDFEFHLVWDGRVLKGYTGTLEWLEDTRETWEEYSQEVEEIIDLGAQVVVVLRLRRAARAAVFRSPKSWPLSGHSTASGRFARARLHPEPRPSRAPAERISARVPSSRGEGKSPRGVPVTKSPRATII